MKKIILLLIVFVTPLWCQPNLEIVWQKDLWPVRIDAAVFSADGQWIYCAAQNDQKIYKMHPETGEFVAEFDNGENYIYEIQSFRISKSGKYLVCDTGSGKVIVWDTESEKLIKYLPDFSSFCVDITSDDKYLLIGSKEPECSIIVYDMEQDKVKDTIHTEELVRNIRVSNNGQYFATGGGYTKSKGSPYEEKRRRFTLWNAETLERIKVLEDSLAAEGYREIKFSWDDRYIVFIALTYDGPTIIDLENFSIVKTTNGTPCPSVTFTPDNHYYILGYKPMQLFDLKSHQEIKSFDFDYYPHLLISSKIFNTKYKVFGGVQNIFFLLDNKSTSIEENIENSSIRIEYIEPNLFIDLNEPKTSNISIIISDIEGNIVYSENHGTLDTIEINLPLETGTYLCKIQCGDKVFSSKFQVVR